MLAGSMKTHKNTDKISRTCIKVLPVRRDHLTSDNIWF